MSDSKKIEIFILLKKKRFTQFFVVKTKNSGVGVIASYSVGFYIFIYFKIYFILIPHSMGSFLT